MQQLIHVFVASPLDYSTSPKTTMRRLPRGIRSHSRTSWRPWSKSWIPNKGTLAQEVDAVKRVLHAWMRTSAGFYFAGVTTAALYNRYTDEPLLPVSGSLIGNGAFLCLVATRRYCNAMAALRVGEFPVKTYGTVLTVGFTTGTTIASMAPVLQRAYSHRF